MTTWGAELDTVAKLVSEAFHLGRPVGIDGWLAQGGAKWYGQRHEYLGATVLSEPRAPGVEDNVHVVMPGEACAVGVDALLQLVTRLRMWSTRCSVARLDLAVRAMTLGRRRPTFGTMQAICVALGLAMSDVIFFEDAAAA